MPQLCARTKLGIYVYGVAAIATGVMDLVFRNFDPAEEPLQAFGTPFDGHRIFACVVGTILVVGGFAVLRASSVRAGAIALAAVYLLFAVFWAPRLYWAPHILGQRVGVYLGILDGVCQQLILVAAAALVYAPQRMGPAARWIFGLCAVEFGLTHLTGIAPVAALVPRWIPFGGIFWAVVTGICFVLAGIAVLSGVLDVLGARLLALMLLVFSALALAPQLVAFPHDQSSWGVNVYNLAAIGATLILSDWLAGRRSASMEAAPTTV